MSQSELTGRKRLRTMKRWFREPLLVLQLEIKGLVPHNDGGRIECEWETWWIDADMKYLSMIDMSIV